MPSQVHTCQCSTCLQSQDHPDWQLHHQMNVFLSRLDEQQRRWYLALESKKIGYGGDTLLSCITGMDARTIRRGRRELDAELANRPVDHVRQKGSVGRLLAEKKQPTLECELEQLISNEAAGDPMTNQKWIRVSLQYLSKRLKEKGLNASPVTVQRILHKMGFSLRANSKKKNGVRANNPERDDQFKYIALLKKEFTDKSLPIISVDTKKKELIGDFKKSGKSWRKEVDEVNEHDFRSFAVCRTVPYGIYDVTKNLGYIIVGTSHDTPKFAADAIALWWELEGQQQYPNADKILILADSGGSNSFRSRAWKHQLQTELSDKYRIVISVSHYPAGCSKWNPIEHRLFSFISKNWEGKPLRTLDMMLGYIRGTRTTTGLLVKAFLLDRDYEKGQKVLTKDFNQLDLRPHATLPEWNYAIHPR